MNSNLDTVFLIIEEVERMAKTSRNITGTQVDVIKEALSPLLTDVYTTAEARKITERLSARKVPFSLQFRYTFFGVDYGPLYLVQYDRGNKGMVSVRLGWSAQTNQSTREILDPTDVLNMLDGPAKGATVQILLG